MPFRVSCVILRAIACCGLGTGISLPFAAFGRPPELVRRSRVSGTTQADIRVVIVAEHASLKFGGEAALPLHYFRVLRRRNVAAWLVVHERTRSELEHAFP